MYSRNTHVPFVLLSAVALIGCIATFGVQAATYASEEDSLSPLTERPPSDFVEDVPATSSELENEEFYESEIEDPFESANRISFAINDATDRMYWVRSLVGMGT